MECDNTAICIKTIIEMYRMGIDDPGFFEISLLINKLDYAEEQEKRSIDCLDESDSCQFQPHNYHSAELRRAISELLSLALSCQTRISSTRLFKLMQFAKEKCPELNECNDSREEKSASTSEPLTLIEKILQYKIAFSGQKMAQLADSLEYFIIVNKSSDDSQFMRDYSTAFNSIVDSLAQNEQYELTSQIMGKIRSPSSDINFENCISTGERMWKWKNYRLSIAILESCMDVEGSVKRDNVYNLIGLSAIEIEDYGLALETYCSRLYSEQATASWEKKMAVSGEPDCDGNALLHSNLAYLLGTIADNIDNSLLIKSKKSSYQTVFREAAIQEITRAINLKKSPSYLCTKATLLFDKFCDLADATDKKRMKKALKVLKESESYYKDYLIIISNSKDIPDNQRIDYVLQKGEQPEWEALRMWLEARMEYVLLDIFLTDDTESIHTGELESVCSDYEKVISMHADEFEKLELYKSIIEIKKRACDCGGASDILWFYALIFYSIGRIRSQLKCDFGFFPVDELNRLIGIMSKYPNSWNCACFQDGEAVKTEMGEAPILFYTCIKAARYLFDELFLPYVDMPPMSLGECVEAKKGEEDDRSILSCSAYSGDFESCQEGLGKNCLTVMHANYMNDPNEGRTLIQYISSQGESNLIFGKPPQQFRDEMLSHNYTFLKSFTTAADKLNMWSLYGSDSNQTEACNGCCIEINPLTFARAVEDGSRNPQEIKEEEGGNIKKGLPSKQDDYHLYKVLYISQIENMSEDNPIELTLGGLRKSIIALEGALGSLPKDKQDFILEALQQQLVRIAYLFKDASYREENEYRLLLFRGTSPEDLKSISRIESRDAIAPDKLCLKPFFQVYIEGITFGPNVKNVDEWIPEFQFSINKIKNKAEKDGIDLKGYVARSSIAYR